MAAGMRGDIPSVMPARSGTGSPVGVTPALSAADSNFAGYGFANTPRTLSAEVSVPAVACPSSGDSTAFVIAELQGPGWDKVQRGVGPDAAGVG